MLLRLIVVTAAALAVVSCDTATSECEPGSAAGCACPSGALGSRECLADGSGWGSCSCGEADGGADGGGDSDGGQDADGLAPASAGPLTYVLSGASVAPERVFDIDGNGSEDNAVADLGVESATVFALMISSMFQRSIDYGERQIFHVPWVEDLAGLDDAAVVVMNLVASDTDVPLDRSDDFSGSEPFYAAPGALDPCGEPLRFTDSATMTAGLLEATGGSFTVSSGLEHVPIRQPRARATIDLSAPSIELLMGGGLTVQDLGASPGDAISPHHTMLEVFLAGGAIVGVETLPGLRPDLDLDGDGLETFELDDAHGIARCVDGDRTIVEGRDCWRDDRFADAFSLTMRFELVGARFAGRWPRWQDVVVGTCDDPPDESLFDRR